jgi:hypothetical protein
MRDLIRRVIRETVTDKKIICDKCDWSWDIADGGDDLYICHKCGHDNEPIKEGKHKERLYIDWDENYGNSFKIVHTPEGAQTGGEWNPDLISIVTPENTNAWYEWEELPEEKLMGWKENWDGIQKGLGTHKYNQIVRSMSNSQQEMKEGELTERCWKGYTQKGMKTMFGKRYPNCVKIKKK